MFVEKKGEKMSMNAFSPFLPFDSFFFLCFLIFTFFKDKLSMELFTFTDKKSIMIRKDY